MKTYVLALLLTFNFSFSKKIEGYYITTNNEKVNTTFSVAVNLLSKEINFEAILFGIKFYDENEKKQKLDLKEVKEIGLDYSGEKIILKCFLNTGNLGTNYIGDKSYVLLKPIKEDIISVYFYPKTTYSPDFMTSGGVSGFSSYDSSVLVRLDGKMVEPYGYGSFKNKMKDFFSDCPELVKKIDEKTYKRKHLVEIIEYYQDNCVH